MNREVIKEGGNAGNLRTTIFLLFLYASFSCGQSNKRAAEPAKPLTSITGKDSIPGKKINLRSFYTPYNLDGLFAFYDPQTKITPVYNEQYYNQFITPASTFNITTTLIALQEGILKDSNSLVIFDGTHLSRNPASNKDIPVVYGFRRNVDWVFLKLRQQIGVEKMNSWIGKLQFGNKQPSADLDTIRTINNQTDLFHVVPASLRITPAQQLEYVQRLYYEQLPFSKKHMQAVKGMMYLKDINGYKLFGKQGSYLLLTENKYIGWHIGWLEKEGKPIFYVNYLQTPDLKHPAIVNAQKEMTVNILDSLSRAGF